MQISIDVSGKFICQCSFDEREKPKRAGFSWDQKKKIWFTPTASVAARLLNYCDHAAKNEIERQTLTVKKWASPIIYPMGLKLFDFQNEAIHFALDRNRCYLALDPGLGKTPIAAVIMNSIYGTFQGLNAFKDFALYICPPFLTRNTQVEFQKWSPFANPFRYSEIPDLSFPSPLIVPDSIIFRDIVKSDIKTFVDETKKKGGRTLIFIDEAHRFKNYTAKRTKALFEIASWFDKQVYMSGTPMPNRPIELFSVLSNAAPEVIDHMNVFQYGIKYCRGFKGEWGWDFSGSSNMEELQKKVKGKFMLRMRKKDVLKSLPDKMEEMLVFDHDMPPMAAAIDKQMLKEHTPEDILNHDSAHHSTYRKEIGLLKVEPALQILKSMLDENEEESFIVFAIHKEVIEILKKELESFLPLVITGSTPMGERHEIVKTFQSSPSHRLFIGNIQAAGTGLTLTKATRVVFVEFDWVPANNDQASDRAHRIGQKDSVFVQYLVYKNSVDAAILEALLAKKKVTAHI